MRSFASLYLFLRMLTFLLFSWTYLTILFGVCCLVIALVRPYKKTYMNNIDALILALLTLNSLQLMNFFRASFKSTDAEFYLWSVTIFAYLPLLLILFHILPCKRLFQWMKHKSMCTRLCCIKDDEMHINEEELLDDDGNDSHRMVHPDQYGGATNGSSEGDALLSKSECILKPEYLSI